MIHYKMQKPIFWIPKFRKGYIFGFRGFNIQLFMTFVLVQTKFALLQVNFSNIIGV